MMKNPIARFNSEIKAVKAGIDRYAKVSQEVAQQVKRLPEIK